MFWKTANAKVTLLWLYLYDNHAMCIYIIVTKVKLNAKVVFFKHTFKGFFNVFNLNSKHNSYVFSTFTRETML